MATILHRQVFILAGSEIWQKNKLQELLAGYENDALWVTEQQLILDSFSVISPNKVRGWLGSEKKIVIFDANKDFEPDSFAAISGIVVGGGIFFLLFPAVEYWKQVYSSVFGQRLIESIQARSEIIVIKEKNETVPFFPEQTKTNILQDFSAPFLTFDQQTTAEMIEQQVMSGSNVPVVLNSDRGRGKSAVLGLVAARLLTLGIKKIVLTAPRLGATDIIFKHIKEQLPDADITRGYVKWNKSMLQFYPPDQLREENIAADLLLVDEAAAIPVPLLTSLLHQYSQCVFSTTVHGYEGTGRGFSVRFFKVLSQYSANWIKLQMKTPVRWAANDPLENWVFKLLCLDAEIADIPQLSKKNQYELEYKILEKQQLADNSLLLEEVFALLVLAHYRTRPKDLKSLLDEESLSVYVSLYHQHVIAVALVTHEGGFSNSLSTRVYRGERRPSGHLLAQSLTYHCGIEYAATLNYSRVMRIAVHPEHQHRGIGTALLEYVIQNEKTQGRDVIGTSFGLNEELLDFWEKLKFEIVRVGFTREQTSGEHAAIMLLPLNERGVKLGVEATTRFSRQCHYWFCDILKDLSTDIKERFCFKQNKKEMLNQFDKDDLESFVQYSRNYELCIGAINKLIRIKQDKIKQKDFPNEFRQIINHKIETKASWKEIAVKMDLTGQNEARKIFHQAICCLLK